MPSRRRVTCSRAIIACCAASACLIGCASQRKPVKTGTDHPLAVRGQADHHAADVPHEYARALARLAKVKAGMTTAEVDRLLRLPRTGEQVGTFMFIDYSLRSLPGAAAGDPNAIVVATITFEGGKAKSVLLRRLKDIRNEGDDVRDLLFNVARDLEGMKSRFAFLAGFEAGRFLIDNYHYENAVREIDNKDYEAELRRLKARGTTTPDPRAVAWPARKVKYYDVLSGISLTVMYSRQLAATKDFMPSLIWRGWGIAIAIQANPQTDLSAFRRELIAHFVRRGAKTI